MSLMRTLHKWGALIVGLQIGVWLISGLVLSLLDPRAVSGENIAAMEPQIESTMPASIIQPSQILQRLAGEQVQSLELKRQLGRWVWRVQSDAGVALLLASSGEKIVVDEKEARRIAFEGYFGEGRLRAATLLTAPSIEARGHALPLWRVDFEDSQRTRYYIGTDEGRILERRNDTWTLFDLMWMLHTMAYIDRDDFNTPWVIAAAVFSLGVAISGVVLLVKALLPRTRNAHS
jgi:hypothetical protein